jgi:hypothetical protein
MMNQNTELMENHPSAMLALYPEALALVAASNAPSSLAARRVLMPAIRPFVAWSPASTLRQFTVSVDATDQLTV